MLLLFKFIVQGFAGVIQIYCLRFCWSITSLSGGISLAASISCVCCGIFKYCCWLFSLVINLLKSVYCCHVVLLFDHGSKTTCKTSILPHSIKDQLDLILQTMEDITNRQGSYETCINTRDHWLSSLTKSLDILENMICKGDHLFQTMIRPSLLRIQLKILWLHILKMKLMEFKC